MGSATRCGSLVDVAIQISLEPATVDGSGTGEHLGDLLAGREPSPSDGDEFADGYTAARHDEGFSLVQSAHDFAAVVAKFALRNRPAHTNSVALVLHEDASDADGPTIPPSRVRRRGVGVIQGQDQERQLRVRIDPIPALVLRHHTAEGVGFND